jgi:hypothetical protein
MRRAQPAALRRKTPEAKDLLLAERERALRRNLPEARDEGSVHSCDGRVKAASAIGELAKSSHFFDLDIENPLGGGTGWTRSKQEQL